MAAKEGQTRQNKLAITLFRHTREQPKQLETQVAQATEAIYVCWG